MKKKIRKEYGITLVALVITIIILLILAGISIQALTQTNLFNKAKQAKNATENAQKEENKILSEYMNKMNEYLPETLASKVNSGEVPIGSYIKYTPDVASEETINNLITELGTYSGSDANTEATLKQETKLKWRILDVIDEQVRLISDTPTTSTIEFKGYDGYNNVVKLLDDAASILYNNENLASKVQNIKIEDIKKHMKIQPTDDSTEYPLTNINYPNILKQEENQTVEENNVIKDKIGVSKQNEFIIGKSRSNTSSLKNTNWSQNTKEDSFKDEKYYKLFIKEDENNYYSKYWISSRCIFANSKYAGFGGRFIDSGRIFVDYFCFSSGGDYSYNCAFRPIITLKSNVQIDIANSGEGTENNAYNIKVFI